jgi:hypothetical protein
LRTKVIIGSVAAVLLLIAGAAIGSAFLKLHAPVSPEPVKIATPAAQEHCCTEQDCCTDQDSGKECLDCCAEDDGNPHAPNAKHPDEVARIMNLLPKIEATDSYEKIIGMLGLPKDWDGGSVSSTHCTMVWRKLAPGYHFALNFDPVLKDGKRTLVFTEASFSADHKPGRPPDEYHTVYPYRSWKGMVHK